MSETVAWGSLAVAASIGLVGVADFIGRVIWMIASLDEAFIISEQPGASAVRGTAVTRDGRTVG